MDIGIIESLDEFNNIKSSYSKLNEDNDNLTPILTHRWLRAWSKSNSN
jgi:hypothetical protein